MPREDWSPLELEVVCAAVGAMVARRTMQILDIPFGVSNPIEQAVTEAGKDVFEVMFRTDGEPIDAVQEFLALEARVGESS